MSKDLIYFSGSEPRGEKAIYDLIIYQLSRGNLKLKSDMEEYHSDEIKSISEMLIKVLGGNIVEARAFNNCFHEIAGRLGINISQLTVPKKTTSEGKAYC